MVNYNYGRYLADAIQSALHQTHRPFEVIVVDDGSTDGSQDVLQSFGSDIQAIFLAHSGQATGMNVAIKRCGGDVICLLDSDDLMLPNRIERIASIFCEHHAVSWVFHGLDLVDRHNLAKLGSAPVYNFTAGYHDERRYLRRGRFSLSAPATSALSWRTSFISSLLPIPDGILGFDNYLKFATLALAPGWVIPEPLALQGIHDRNLYTTMTGSARRAFYLANGVQMAPTVDNLGLPRLAERLMADAWATARGATALDNRQAEILDTWLDGLTLTRKLRFFRTSARVAIAAAISRLRNVANSHLP